MWRLPFHDDTVPCSAAVLNIHLPRCEHERLLGNVCACWSVGRHAHNDEAVCVDNMGLAAGRRCEPMWRLCPIDDTVPCSAAVPNIHLPRCEHERLLGNVCECWSVGRHAHNNKAVCGDNSGLTAGRRCEPVWRLCTNDDTVPCCAAVPDVLM
jgi:hypothetical protein